MRRPLLLALALTSLALAACGEEEKTVTNGESEAFYVTNGDLQYQVQMSRQMNPFLVGDRNYLVGIPAGERRLGEDEVWFGVFMRVTNDSGESAVTADRFEIEDTRGRVYRPVALAGVNTFAYKQTKLANDGIYPTPGSAAANAPNNGSLLLFKLPVAALEFRPLELVFTGPSAQGDRSTIRLDV